MLKLTKENLLICQNKSQNNDAEAICDLARFYYYGKFVGKDVKHAFELCQKSADLGSARALKNLGICYEYAEGVQKNNQRAYDYYMLAAQKGCAEAYACLGNCCFNGYCDVPIDKSRAFSYYLKGAELGDSTCQYYVGWFYHSGEVVAYNIEEAVKWYQKSADNGNVDAMIVLGNCLDRGDGITKDSRLAFEYYLKAAKEDNSTAQYYVGTFYHAGDVIERNYNEAISWYKKSADNDNSDALDMLGNCYYYGDGVTLDRNQALAYYVKAANLGNVHSMLLAGYMNDFGDGVAKNYQQAVYWYTKASDSGDGDATLNLANMYIEGKGVAKNILKGNDLYRKAIQQHNPIAASNLGNHYLLGNGVPVSFEEGAKYIRMAEEWGYIHSEDMNNLGCSYKGVKNYTEAYKCFKKAVEADDTNQMALWNYGFSLYNGQGTDVDYRASEQYLTSFLKRNPNHDQAKLLVKGIELYKNLENCLTLLLQFIKTHNAAIVDMYLNIDVKSENEVIIFVSFIRWDNHRNDNRHIAYYLSEYWDDFESMFSLHKAENSSVGEKCFYFKKVSTIALTKQDVFSVIVNLFKKYPDISLSVDYNRCEITYSEH